MAEYFNYSGEQTEYLSRKDPALGRQIALIGKIEREVTPDIFEALVDSIVGQQISSKAHRTIMARIREALGSVTPGAVDAISESELQAFGISFRKAGYIKEAAARVISGAVDLATLSGLPEQEICRVLTALPGIGKWTAEMLMIFSLQRPDILSFGDLGLRRGLCLLHRHREITPRLYQKYARLYSPYATVASLYLWEIAGGGLREE